MATISNSTITVLVLASFISLTSFADSVTSRDEIRQDIKQMTTAGHHPMDSYRTAREYLFGEIHLERDKDGYFVRDVYCSDIVRADVGPKHIPNARVINTEHTWPKSRFSKRAPYNSQLTDLHHLYPTNSEANGRRGNYRFFDFAHNRPVQSGCENSHMGRIPETGNDGFEPPDEHKGNVARALFYFSVRYDLSIDAYEEFHLRAWHILDPVDQEELRRNDIVERVQGNRNPFIDDPSLVEQVSNF